MLNDKVVLITGGTGSFGHRFTGTILKQFKLKKLIIFSRDEFKQFEMSKIFPTGKYPIRYFLGDIRDKSRLCRAFSGVDYVIHAAALKQVPALEYNPTEAVKTNVVGADNIVEAAIDAGVKKVISLSTDKSVNPINLYGATKLVAEKIFVAANSYSGHSVQFSVVRYGNVIASRGSVVEHFLELNKKKVKTFPITDREMTRFWMTLKQSVDLVLYGLQKTVGGEIFVPKIPSMRITDLAKALNPNCKLRLVGVRPGEKVHETLISEDEARLTLIKDDIYVILPQFLPEERYATYKQHKAVPNRFVYKSDTNDEWLTILQLQKIIRRL